MMQFNQQEIEDLFSSTLRFKGVNKSSVKDEDNSALMGKTLGIVHAASWISIWGDYFGKLLLPGVRLMHICDDSVQYNFMKAKEEGLPVPPQENIDRFSSYAEYLHKFGADAVIMTCSTMNRSYQNVVSKLSPYNCPVIQIDIPMMKEAIMSGKKIGLLLTLNTSVASSQMLLEEVASELGKTIDYQTYVDEEAFTVLGQGNIREHNNRLSEIIKKAADEDGVGIIVLAQLSMAVFQFSYPAPEKSFGIPVLNSGYTGFMEAKKILSAMK